MRVNTEINQPGFAQSTDEFINVLAEFHKQREISNEIKSKYSKKQLSSMAFSNSIVNKHIFKLYNNTEGKMKTLRARLMKICGLK